MVEIKGFITNLGAYNDGCLLGEWITFPVGNGELNEVLSRIGCSYIDENGVEHNTNYEEYFFTDWESNIDIELGEYESIERLNEISETLSLWDDDTLEAACEIWGIDEVLEMNSDDVILFTSINDNYDLGEYYALELDCIDFKGDELLERYFDFESYGRDIYFEADGDFSSLGWVEYIG